MTETGHPQAQGQAGPRLFEPLALRGLVLRNRVMTSPMAMYSAPDGFADDFHLVHLGRFALGGSALVFIEATAVSPEARITHGCVGLWDDAQKAPLQRIVDFLHRLGAAAGMQLGHAGRKGSARRPWHGGAPLDDSDAADRGEEEWPLVSSSAAPFAEGWPVPAELDEAELDGVVADYARAAARARACGFDVIELHCAHGYLLHSFLSPLANGRDDAYGGSLENRMRLPLRVAEAVRTEWPDDKPMFARISSVDGVGVGWTLEDSVTFASALKALGVDAIDCSSGGMMLSRENVLVARSPGFHVPFAAEIRRQAGIPTIAVGLIREPAHAEQIIAEGSADLIALAREMLFDPNWAARAALELMGDAGWALWPDQFRYWLERRARALAKAQAR